MEALAGILIGSQLVLAVVATIYFYTNLKMQNNSKNTIHLETKKELEKMKKLRGIKLTEPLSEKTRPEDFNEIIGQERGIKALRAALCGPNPQHVIIYGPPGVGKTAAARIILKEASKSSFSPFTEGAPFIEMDATILQFDERSIADPLIGSVHDPIYQGAGAYGPAGIPQPKAGAVTKAHGGILFLDEIGELHNLQMNKLLKVLEDRKVFLTSSYYSKEDSNIPKHVHDIFENGLPADFRLIGATTRRPEEIPPALRSRCTEVFFRSLSSEEVSKIAEGSIQKAGFEYDEKIPDLISLYSSNGRDTVNIVQTSISVASLASRNHIKIEDVEEVVEFSRYTTKQNKKVVDEQRIGVINGLAVYGGGNGSVMEIEATTKLANIKGSGILKVTGIVDEEEISNGASKMRRISTARGSLENVLTMLTKTIGVSLKDYDIHVNFPGGGPVDGPSAGVAMFCVIYSSIMEEAIDGRIAMTGEISIKGKVNPVGGVSAKIEAAIEAGITKVFIPKTNYQKSYANYGIEVVCIDNIQELLLHVFGKEITNNPSVSDTTLQANLLTAQSGLTEQIL